MWFAFRFDLLDICHKDGDSNLIFLDVVICFQIWFIGYLSQATKVQGEPETVVICFQIWFIGYLSQVERAQVGVMGRCDLLSDLIYWIFVTSKQGQPNYTLTLWFAFRFDLLDICHKSLWYRAINLCVVICFQIWFIGYLS